MTLIVLFLLSTGLLLLNIKSLVIAGTFLSICYLPGLCLFTLVRRKEIGFEDLLLAFPCSVGISSLLILVLLFLGADINHVPFILHVLIGITSVFYIIKARKHDRFVPLKISKHEMLFGIFALAVTLLLSIPFFIGVNRIGISGHAFHHSLMVSQILNGIFPPENPGMGGTLIGYYWGFHAFIAALTTWTDYQQIQVSFLINLLSLFFLFCFAYRFAKFFALPELYCYILPLAIIGLMRSDTGILFLIKLVTGQLASFEKLTAVPIEPIDILLGWIKGLSWVDTRQIFPRKLYNISGMLLALTLCFGYLTVLIRMVKEKTGITSIYSLCIALIISACIFNYPPLAIFMLLHAPVWACYVFISTGSGMKEKVREVSRIIIPYAAAGLIVAPYMLFVMSSRSISSSGQGSIFSLDFYDQSLKNMAVFALPLPVIAYGAWVAVKRFAQSKELVFVLVSTGLCLSLTMFTRWPFDNSYKFNYILLFFFALFFVLALNRFTEHVRNVRVQNFFAGIVILFLSLTPVIVESSHIVSAFSTGKVYEFAEGSIFFGQDRPRNEAYRWIRENTPGNSLLMLSFIETNWPCCAFNNNYEAAAVSERTLYAIKDTSYTTSNPAYGERISLRGKLLNGVPDPLVRDFFVKLGRPVYLLVEKNLDRDSFYVEERFKELPPQLGDHFVLEYENSRQWVYSLRLFSDGTSDGTSESSSDVASD